MLKHDSPFNLYQKIIHLEQEVRKTILNQDLGISTWLHQY
ncbi:hypothetical protein KTI78_07510 [Acinetobacter sp. WU_MDCI_Abxe161]|nr:MULTISPECIES: hypothetical protein [Acinetobacter]MCG9513641.1 hypothetical protein [Acinetobacter pittii]MCU4503015.1 hypothetical protein [Acinetobacter sp. WU_MDCI_Abxe161]MDX8254489.1 hypothetical protein [Acinetobacter pittii]WPP69647.1 hypothetical protein SOI81_15000 [Acinetobacter pittii]